MGRIWTTARPKAAPGPLRALKEGGCACPEQAWPMFRPRCGSSGPNSENPHFPLQSSHQNRIFRAEVHPATPPSGPWWFGVLRGVSPAHVGPRGTRIRPRVGPSGQKKRKIHFSHKSSPKITLFVKKYAPAAPQPGPRCPRALRDDNQPHIRPAGPRIRLEGNSEKCTRKR